MLGMKNPVPLRVNRCAYFGFYDDPDAGVLISYVNCSGRKIIKGLARKNTRNAYTYKANSTASYKSDATNQNVRGKKFTRKRINTWGLLGGKRRAEF